MVAYPRTCDLFYGHQLRASRRTDGILLTNVRDSARLVVYVLAFFRVGRAGRFGTKGLAVTFVASQEDTNVLNDVQTRFEVHIPEMPATIDASQYINQ